MSQRKYQPVQGGEWVQPIKRGYGMACCDCGLVHRLNFRIYKGRIQFQASRDNRASGQLRRRPHNFIERPKPLAGQGGTDHG